MRTAVVVPSLGAPSLAACIEALRAQTASPDRLVVVLSGSGETPDLGPDVEIILERRRLGFAAAVNRGLAAVLGDVEAVALLNDDALPDTIWLEALTDALRRTGAAGVQGTVSDGEGRSVDGRGIAFDRWGLPIQVDRGLSPDDGERGPEIRLGLSATAALFRCDALRAAALPGGMILDESFDSYHEDTDLMLRLHRLGLEMRWAPGAPCRHLGSATGSGLGLRRPWWLLANRWRALAGNLTLTAFLSALPRLTRGEIRAVRTLVRDDPSAVVVAAGVLAAVPFIAARSLARPSRGQRLDGLPLQNP